MESRKIGLRKFKLAIIYGVLFLIAIIILAIASGDFKMTYMMIGAAGLGFTTIIGAVVYGYTKEYKFKDEGEK